MSPCKQLVLFYGHVHVIERTFKQQSDVAEDQNKITITACHVFVSSDVSDIFM